MYTVVEHLRRAEDMLARASASRLRDASDDWWIVFAFYGCLHLVQAHLVSTNAHPSDHASRRDAIRRDRVLPRAVKDDYTFLYNLSIDVRYNPVFATTHAECVDADQAISTIVNDVKPRVAAWMAANP